MILGMEPQPTIIQKIRLHLVQLTLFQAAVIIAAVGLFAYLNALPNAMFWDDLDSIVNNAYIQDWSYFPKYFSENLIAGAGLGSNYWRPLLMVSFAIDHSVGGLSPLIFHFQSICWHLLSAFLVYVFVRKVIGLTAHADADPASANFASLFAALLFALHPMQTEAVTYVAGRADPMHSALLLGSLLLFIRVMRATKVRWLDLLLSVLLFAAALMTKERAVVMALILPLVYWVLRSKFVGGFKRFFLVGLPYAATFFIYVALRFTVLHFSDTFDPGAEDSIGAPGVGQKIQALLKAFAYYHRLFLWPDNLRMERIFAAPASVLDPWVVGGVALLIGWLALAWACRRKQPAVTFGSLWFLAVLAPSIHVLPIQGILYEHWLYLPMLGWALVFGIAGSKLLSSKRTVIVTVTLVLAGIILAALLVRTMVRNRDWREPVTFYEKTIAQGGATTRTYTNLGISYDDAGEHEKAVAAYGKALELSPELFVVWYDLGNSYVDMKRMPEALAAFENARKFEPSFVPAWTNAISVLAHEGKMEEALVLAQEAEKVNPNDPRIISALAAMYWNTGARDQAEPYLKMLEAFKAR